MAQPWVKQEELKKEKLPDPNDIINMAFNLKMPRTKALFVTCYLTGGRINEVLKIKNNDIFFENIDGKDIVRIQMLNEKNRKNQRKDIPIVIEHEKELVTILKDYIKDLMPEELLFKISRYRAYQILIEQVGWNPHYLRHIRASHLVTKYNFSDQKLVQYLGWTDSRPASRYIHLNWKNLI